jgi:large subunit ribosomal protein L10
MKELIVRHLDQRLGGIEDTVVVDISRLDAESNRAIRRELRKSGISVNVVKNSLAKRVFSARGLDFPAEVLTGPTAFLVGGADAIATSKVVADWRKKNKKEIQFKGGLIEGVILGPAEAERLTKMPGVRETRQMLVSVLAAPLSQFVGVLQSILAGVPGVLQAIAEKQKKEGE